jgi:hypothetical protein
MTKQKFQGGRTGDMSHLLGKCKALSSILREGAADMGLIELGSVPSQVLACSGMKPPLAELKI